MNGRVAANATAYGAALTAVLPPEVPISIYSEAAVQAKYGGSVYGSKILSNHSPFVKNTDFRKPVTDIHKPTDPNCPYMAAAL